MDWLSKIFGTDFFLDADSADPYKKPFAGELGPNPNDNHAHGSSMDWLSKVVGADFFGGDSIDSFKN